MGKKMREMQKESVNFLKTEENSGNALSSMDNSYLLIKMKNLGNYYNYRFFSTLPIPSPTGTT